jgi:hypothetical protein
MESMLPGYRLQFSEPSPLAQTVDHLLEYGFGETIDGAFSGSDVVIGSLSDVFEAVDWCTLISRDEKWLNCRY